MANDLFGVLSIILGLGFTRTIENEMAKRMSGHKGILERFALFYRVALYLARVFGRLIYGTLVLLELEHSQEYKRGKEP